MAVNEPDDKNDRLTKLKIIELQIEPRIDCVKSHAWLKMHRLLMMMPSDRVQQIASEIRDSTPQEALELIAVELSA